MTKTEIIEGAQAVAQYCQRMSQDPAVLQEVEEAGLATAYRFFSGIASHYASKVEVSDGVSPVND